MRADLHTILDNPSSLERYQTSSEFREIIDGYKTYAKKTEDGEHGKTAQYSLVLKLNDTHPEVFNEFTKGIQRTTKHFFKDSYRLDTRANNQR